MKYLLRAVSTEILKIKKTPALWLTLGAPLFVIGIQFMIYLFRGHLFVKAGAEPWTVYYRGSIGISVFLLLPLYVTMITALLNNIEFKYDTWKQMYSLPQPKWTVYAGKMVMSLIMITTAFVIFYIFMPVSGYILSIFRSDLGFREFDARIWFLGFYIIKIYIAIMGITALQFWFSMRFKNFIVPMGIGILGVIMGAMLQRWENVIYYPYAYPFVAYMEMFTAGADGVLGVFAGRNELLSVGAAIVIFTAGYFDVSRRGRV